MTMHIKRCELQCRRPAVTSIAGVAVCKECAALTEAIRADAERDQARADRRKETAA